MRPTRLDEIVGQEHILGSGKLLRRLIEEDRVPSMVLWGPPGTGKTTLARIIAARSKSRFYTLSAVLSGVQELRKILEEARTRRGQFRERAVLFVDEIHRWSKSQQDALLPAVESGLVTLIGATTENPSFELNAALLSRARVFLLKSVSDEALKTVIQRGIIAMTKDLGIDEIQIGHDALEAVVAGADGDVRRALQVLEIAGRASIAVQSDRVVQISQEIVQDAFQYKALLYDKKGDQHYGVVSAFIKSMRGSDPDAAAYYLVRMLESGEDPRFLLRRMVIFASEDIGNADPQALAVALGAVRAYEFVGLPESALTLTQAATYLACAPKSNAALTTYASARKDVLEKGPLPVPERFTRPVADFAKKQGRGQQVQYPHDVGGFVQGETYLPEALVGHRYYEPKDSGFEFNIKSRLASLRDKDSS